eukprot:536513-Hanusia_phi.AAC.3
MYTAASSTLQRSSPSTSAIFASLFLSPVPSSESSTHIPQQLHRRRADPPGLVEEPALDGGQHERHGGVGEVIDYVVSGLERDLPHGVALVSEAGEDGGEDARDEGLQALSHGVGEGRQQHEVSFPHMSCSRLALHQHLLQDPLQALCRA